MTKGTLGTILAIFVILGVTGSCLVMSFNHLRKYALGIAARGECVLVVPHEVIDGKTYSVGTLFTERIYELQYRGKYSGNSKTCFITKEVTKNEYERKMYASK